MPMYEYLLPSGERITKLFRSSSAAPRRLELEQGNAYRVISAPARMAHHWGVATHGEYDPDLKCVVSSEKHRDAILAERGLERASDHPGWVTKSIVTANRQMQVDEQWTALNARYDAEYKEAGIDRLDPHNPRHMALAQKVDEVILPSNGILNGSVKLPGDE